MQFARGHRGWRSGVIAAGFFLGALAFTTARQAQASCDIERNGLLWSYPANGAQDVPIDADLFVNGSLNGLPSLAGEPLPRIAAGVYDLGELAPETRYEIRWAEAVIVFSTGSTTEFPPRDPASDVLVTRSPIEFARCPLVLSQGCFDTGAPTRVRFDVGPARAWLIDVLSCDGSVRQLLWPYACGAPLVESQDRIICASARSTQGAGFSGSTGVICSVPDVPLDTLPRSSGCRGAWPPDDALTLAAGDAIIVGSRSGPATRPDEAQPDDPSPAAAAPPAEPSAGCTLAPPASGAGAGIGGMAGAGLAALMITRRRRARAASSLGG